jgi:hypothetical protein
MDIVVRNLDDGSTITILTGSASDQAAFLSPLCSIRDMRLLLLSVQCVENQEQRFNYFRREKEMRYARFTILLGILVSTLVAGWVIAAAQAQWDVIVPQTSFGDKLRVAAFLNDNFGITGGAGDVGKAHYTSDGGKNWATADSSGG